MRKFGHIQLTQADLEVLCQLIKPLSLPSNSGLEPATLLLLCEKLYLARLELTTKQLTIIDVYFDVPDVMILNYFVCPADGHGMEDVLKQSHEVLYEIRNDIPVVYLAKQEEVAALLNAFPKKPRRSKR
jgi:hypothetical protein